MEYIEGPWLGARVGAGKVVKGSGGCLLGLARFFGLAGETLGVSFTLTLTAVSKGVQWMQVSHFWIL